MKFRDKILAWSALAIFGLGVIFVIIPAIYYLISRTIEPDIRDHCGEIYTAEFENLLNWDGFDSIPRNGNIELVNISTEICESFNHLHSIESPQSKDGLGFVEFRFYDYKHKYIGRLDLEYKPNSKGYYIQFGSFKKYGSATLPGILLMEVKKKYPPTALR